MRSGKRAAREKAFRKREQRQKKRKKMDGPVDSLAFLLGTLDATDRMSQIELSFRRETLHWRDYLRLSPAVFHRRFYSTSSLCHLLFSFE